MRRSRSRVVTIAIASSALIGAFLLGTPTTNASPERIAQIEAELEALGREEANANEMVLTAQYEYDQITAKIERTQGKVDQAKADLKETQGSIGRYAAAAYRTGGIDSSLQLLLADDPQEFLDSAVVLDIVANSQNAALRKSQVARLNLAQASAELTQQQAQAEAVLVQMEANKAALEEKIAETEAYLADLEEEERQRLAEERQRRLQSQEAAAQQAIQQGGFTGGSSGGSTVGSDRAAIAVAYALAQVGEPYVNTPPGAQPPNSWDCTKLTAAAWAQAGVRLTPYSYVQAREVRQISTNELQPGDLLFFFRNGAHHASMYIGGGQIVEASSPQTGVRITSVWNSWNVAHFSWAGRPYG